MDRAPRVVEQRSSEFFDAARALLGRRLAECRYGADRGLYVTVIDLTAEDRASLDEVAVGLGITGWTRVDRADPSHLDAWQGLRRDLSRLSAVRPPLLSMFPGSDTRYQRPPVEIFLTAVPDAVAAAADLHDRYGDFVTLHVGALPFPPVPGTEQPSGSGPFGPREPVDPEELDVTLDGPLSVPTGETVIHAILVRNRGDHQVVVQTDGDVRAHVIDPLTGATVSCFSGAHPVPMVTFTADPGRTVRIPLLVSTSSRVPALGYSVPAGTWQLTAELDLTDGRHLVTAPMDLTIT